MGRVFVTGDIHGSADILKLTGKYWPEGRSLSRDDLLVICGDFGLVWSEPPSDATAFWLDWLEARPWTTLFLDGNHENHDLLDAMAATHWRGGKVHVLPGHPHVMHLMRGQVFDMGKHGRWFIMGGARSQDREWRTEGTSWWAREMPSDEEYGEATAALESAGWAVDYVFTHDCPSDLLAYAMPWFMAHPAYAPEIDALTNYLQYVNEKLDESRLKRWYGGHYHGDRCLGSDRHVLLYNQIVELGDVPVEDAAAGQFVPGAGIAIGDCDVPFEQVAMRERATMDELVEFMDGKTCTVGPDGKARINPTDQEAFRQRINAMRRKQLMEAGPTVDIL